jgi:hypothetical protein
VGYVCTYYPSGSSPAGLSCMVDIPAGRSKPRRDTTSIFFDLNPVNMKNVFSLKGLSYQ